MSVHDPWKYGKTSHWLIYNRLNIFWYLNEFKKIFAFISVEIVNKIPIVLWEFIKFLSFILNIKLIFSLFWDKNIFMVSMRTQNKGLTLNYNWNNENLINFLLIKNIYLNVWKVL